jgi:hypothetical protein
MTLIRLVRALPDPAVSASPRVLGVDEFALRKGRRYGTLLAGVETRRPVDILPERSSDSFAAWLAARPGAQLICRNRAGVYSDGGNRGAPDAVQVADRWHLWHNLGEAVERAVSRHRGHLAAAVTPQAGVPAAAAPSPPALPPEARRTGKTADRTRARHADVRRLLAGNRNYREIAAMLGLSRNTVRRFARAASPEELLVRDGTGRQASILDSMRITCASGGTPAAPTPHSCTRSSAPADTKAAPATSASTSRATARPRPPVPWPRSRRRSRP